MADLPGPVQDLNVADGPLLAFGGPLGNAHALSALLAEAERLGIPPRNMVCTGDVAGYFAEPEACARTLREAGIATVMGNVEENLGAGAADCGCDFIPGSTCDALAPAWYAHADRTISAETRAWMAALPRRIHIRLGGARLAALHGGAAQINRYVFESDAAAMTEELAMLGPEANAAIAGHAGMPFTRILGARAWHNPGSPGLPANDGTARVWFSVIAEEDDRLAFTHHALEYDHAGAAATARDMGLPEA